MEENKIQILPPENGQISKEGGTVKKKPKRDARGLSYPNRLLQALATVYEDDKATAPEKLAAVRMSLEALEIRGKPKRKTDRDREVLKVLAKNSLDKPGKPKKPDEVPPVKFGRKGPEKPAPEEE